MYQEPRPEVPTIEAEGRELGFFLGLGERCEHCTLH